MLASVKKRAMLEGMLSVLGAVLILASRVNRQFREELGERNGVAEIRTEDRSVARRFYVFTGKIQIARGCHPSPDFALIYRDVPTALTLFRQGTDEAALKAISEGSLRFEGDMAFGMWFMELLKRAGGFLKKPASLVSL